MGLEKLGRYDIIRPLGKGAMGLVYEAHDPQLDRRVAIKTIKVESLSIEAAREYEARFRTEARSAARLQHANIVSVYDSGRHQDVAYLVMEFVQGDDLKSLLDGGRTFTLEQTLQLMLDLLSALEYAHHQHIVHRDVKPANLLIEADGRVKLTDFGVARIQDSDENTRTRGSMVGTLKYMSPEQAQGLAVDARSDLFAAGVVLYQLLTGSRPFDGESDFAIIQQIVGATPAPPSSIDTRLPAAIDAVVARALAKQREQRFPSARVFALALQEAVGLATDQTIVPPRQRRASGEGGGSGSAGLRSVAGAAFTGVDGSGVTVTQELELVYWKDVKDSSDAADLRGFLDRFPYGIYADLARRRLRTLAAIARGDPSFTQLPTRDAGAAAAGADSAFPTTVQLDDGSQSAAPDGAEPTRQLVHEATVLQKRMVDATAVQTRVMEPTALQTRVIDGTGSSVGFASTLQWSEEADPAASMATGQDASTAAGVAAGSPPASEPGSAVGDAPLPGPAGAAAPAPQGSAAPSALETHGQRRRGARGGRLPLLVALAGLLVLGGLALWAFGPVLGPVAAPTGPAAAVVAPGASAPLVAADAAAPASAATPVPAPAPISIATGAGASVVAPPAVAAVAASTAASASQRAAGRPLPGAVRDAAGSGRALPAPALPPLAAASTAVAAAAASAPALAVRPPVAAGPASQAAPALSDSSASLANLPATSPEVVCKDRVLLGFQICMNEQCAKPVFAGHPVCQQRRAADAQRAAQQQQNNRN